MHGTVTVVAGDKPVVLDSIDGHLELTAKGDVTAHVSKARYVSLATERGNIDVTLDTEHKAFVQTDAQANLAPEVEQQNEQLANLPDVAKVRISSGTGKVTVKLRSWLDAVFKKQ
eukprot:m.199036 g.199036  ORF g.199036 m.199036 type:complete len:115 (+) comp25904_c0_seq7:220-564(+)